MVKRARIPAVAAIATCLLATGLASAPTRGAEPGTDRALAAAARCHGHRATIVGSKHGETIVGTKKADVIAAKGGTDAIFGKGGRDIICGGKGPDILNGMQGPREPLYGGKGSDFCFAPNATEHQYHHGCEVHLPSNPQHKVSVTEAAPPRISVTPTVPSATRGSKRDALRAVVGAVTCDLRSIYASTNANPMLATGGGQGYPDPTVVRVLPYVFSWNGQWIPRGNLGSSDWNVPNDGAYYELDPSWNVSENYWLVYYAFGWWNGSQWVWTSQYTPVNDYQAFGGLNSGVCVTTGS